MSFENYKLKYSDLKQINTGSFFLDMFLNNLFVYIIISLLGCRLPTGICFFL